jgi:hypothetical protein
MNHSTSKVQLLTGPDTYQGWATAMRMRLLAKKLVTYNEDKQLFEFSTDPGKAAEASLLIIDYVSLDIAGTILETTPLAIWESLLASYGRTNAFDIKSEIKNMSMVGIDPVPYFDKIKTKLVALNNCGSALSPEDLLDALMRGVHQEFYVDVLRSTLRDIKTKTIDASDVKNFQNDIIDLYHVTPPGWKQNFSKPVANAAEQRPCEFCDKHNRFRIKHTHKTATCHFGDVAGWTKLPEFANDASKGNNQPSAYFASFWDSGCTPRSFFCDKPLGFVAEQGVVYTANKQPVKTLGHGYAQFGDLRIDNITYAPTFGKNLLSGIQIMKAGYKQILDNDKLTISKDGCTVASGSFDAATGLIKMDSSTAFHVDEQTPSNPEVQAETPPTLPKPSSGSETQKLKHFFKLGPTTLFIDHSVIQIQILFVKHWLHRWGCVQPAVHSVISAIHVRVLRVYVPTFQKLAQLLPMSLKPLNPTSRAHVRSRQLMAQTAISNLLTLSPATPSSRPFPTTPLPPPSISLNELRHAWKEPLARK